MRDQKAVRRAPAQAECPPSKQPSGKTYYNNKIVTCNTTYSNVLLENCRHDLNSSSVVRTRMRQHSSRCLVLENLRTKSYIFHGRSYKKLAFYLKQYQSFGTYYLPNEKVTSKRTLILGSRVVYGQCSGLVLGKCPLPTVSAVIVLNNVVQQAMSACLPTPQSTCYYTSHGSSSPLCLYKL